VEGLELYPLSLSVATQEQELMKCFNSYSFDLLKFRL